jgi:hypothetical protein
MSGVCIVAVLISLKLGGTPEHATHTTLPLDV